MAECKCCCPMVDTYLVIEHLTNMPSAFWWITRALILLTTNYWDKFYIARSYYQLTSVSLPSAGLSITILLFGSLTPVSVTGRLRLGGLFLPRLGLSVITIHGGSPSPVYISTAALFTWKLSQYSLYHLQYMMIYINSYLMWFWSLHYMPCACFSIGGKIFITGFIAKGRKIYITGFIAKVEINFWTIQYIWV